MFCSNCGAALADNAYACQNCGMPVNQNYGNVPPHQQEYLFQNQQQLTPASCKMNTGMLVWSIISCFLFNGILGIFSIVFTVLASKEVFYKDEIKKLRIAKIINIISAVLAVIEFILFAVIIIAIIQSGYMFPYYTEEFLSEFYTYVTL